MKAAELKIGDTFKKQGFTFTVAKITEDGYKNGNPSLLVECVSTHPKYNPSNNTIDTTFHFKPDTKIK